MKIALCLSGQARSLEKGHEFVKKNILDGNDVTIFIHTWESDIIQKVDEVYKPEAMMVEKPIDRDLSGYKRPPATEVWKPKDPVMTVFSQWQSVYRANELKRSYEENENMKFDWVIRTRFDFAINVKLPFDELDNTKIYIPNCRITPGRDFGNDQFAFSSSENMDKYSKVFEYIDTFYNMGVPMINEEMMSANIKQFGLIGENLVYFNPHHLFPPGPNNGTWHSLLREDFESWQK